MRSAGVLAVLVLAGLFGAARADAFTTGFFDPYTFNGADAAARQAGLALASDVGARRSRIDVLWSSVAPTRPPDDGAAADPSWEGYNWSNADQAVSDMVARGIEPVLTVDRSPVWAQLEPTPRGQRDGTWKPDPRAYALFARAVARRYSGTFGGLPRVRYFQAWNEPNLNYYLAPQWEDGKAFAPAHYRKLLNGFYAAVKDVNPDNVVITGGTGPFGDPGQGRRTMPALFVRALLCERLADSGGSCPKTYFDVLDHHPYGTRGPFSPAYNKDDVVVLEVKKKLIDLVERAIDDGHVGGSRKKQYWTTEIGWDSSPPDPNGVPEKQQAQWLEESMYLLWKQGVTTAMWLLVRDELPKPSYDATYQSGVFLNDGTPKMSARAYRFPFVVFRKGEKAASVWGRRGPAGTKVRIERAVRDGWKLVKTLKVGADQTFSGRVGVRDGWTLRATALSDQSLPAGVPSR